MICIHRKKSIPGYLFKKAGMNSNYTFSYCNKHGVFMIERNPFSLNPFWKKAPRKIQKIYQKIITKGD